MLKGKKTILFFVLALVISSASLFGFTEYQPTGDEAAIIVAVTSLAGIFLRTVTNTPVFKKE